MRPRGRGWRVAWRVRNGGPRPLRVREAWHPHRRLHSSRLRRATVVAAGRSAVVEVPARTDARRGETVENCFLILRVSEGRARFRVLVRSTLRMADDGTPGLRVEAIDVHPAAR